jgi:hypothetical protein
MANTTTFVRSENRPILLDKETAILIVEKLQELKELCSFRFENNELDAESRLDFARTMVECDNINDYLKENLK